MLNFLVISNSIKLICYYTVYIYLLPISSVIRRAFWGRCSTVVTHWAADQQAERSSMYLMNGLSKYSSHISPRLFPAQHGLIVPIARPETPRASHVVLLPMCADLIPCVCVCVCEGVCMYVLVCVFVRVCLCVKVC